MKGVKNHENLYTWFVDDHFDIFVLFWAIVRKPIISNDCPRLEILEKKKIILFVSPPPLISYYLKITKKIMTIWQNKNGCSNCQKISGDIATPCQAHRTRALEYVKFWLLNPLYEVKWGSLSLKHSTVCADEIFCCFTK